MEFKVTGENLRRMLGDNGKECYTCGETDAELTICKACNLTKCPDCMSNEDLCEECMVELEMTGHFDVYTSDEFIEEMKEKHLG